MHKLVAAVGLFRAPIICMAVYIAALLPGQSREFFRAVREAQRWDFVVEIGRTAAFALALALVVLTVCALLMKHVPEHRKLAVDANFGLLEMLAIGLAGIPILSVWLLNIDFTTVEGTGSETVLEPATWGVVQVNHIAYGATFLAVAAALGLLARRGTLRSAIVSAFARPALPYGLGLAAGACIVGGIVLAVSAAIIQAPLWVAGIFGPFGLLCVFFGILTIASSMMTAVYDRRGWPILSGLAFAALLFAYMGWSNNHEVRSLIEKPKQEARPDQPPKSDNKEAQALAEKAAERKKDRTPGGEFAEWLEARPDRPHYVGRPYPVYIVAAEGGGLYAAAHAASVLARLQDECPGFARHVFAISGVSGGSLGAAVFTSLIDALPPGDGKGCEPAPNQAKPLLPLVKRYFQNDFLSPLLAYGLFPDFLQRFVPIGIPLFDRARGLEAAFEAAWEDTLSQIVSPLPETTAFGASLRSLWSASASKPALLLNATSVHYGSRIVIAPFVLDNAVGFTDIYIDLLNQGETVTLSTAVGVGARFPVITPPSWKKTQLGGRLQMVDGGYYENSGIATAAHLIDAIIRHARASSAPQQEAASLKNDLQDNAKSSACVPNNMVSVKTQNAGLVPVCFKIIVIRTPRRQSPRLIEHGELTAPLFAAYNVLSGHERANTGRVQSVYCGGTGCGRGSLAKNPHVYFRYLTAANVPLGWYFSKSTLERVLRAPPETECVSQKDMTDATAENACLSGRVRGDLD